MSDLRKRISGYQFTVEKNDSTLDSTSLAIADGSYTAQLAQYRTPFSATFRLKFAGDEVTIEYEMNVGLGHNQPVVLTDKTR